MIRQLTENDRTDLLEYLYQESSYNIFLIGDVEAFGFDKEWQTLYGEFDEQGNYISVLLFYRENAIYYSHIEVFNTAYLPYITERNVEYLSGKEVLMRLIYPHLKGFRLQLEHFAKATTIKLEETTDCEIRLLTSRDDFSKLYDLLYTITEFGIYKKDRENFIEGKINSLKMSYTLGVFVDGVIAATAATTADTTVNSMIVGVATHKNYRTKGYASALVSKIMKEYINHQNKELCLFYDNPKAGKIYLRLGFENIGKWIMLVKE